MLRKLKCISTILRESGSWTLYAVHRQLPQHVAAIHKCYSGGDSIQNDCSNLTKKQFNLRVAQIKQQVGTNSLISNER